MRIEDSIAELVAKLVDERLAKNEPNNNGSLSDASHYLSVEKAAARLDVSESYIRKCIRAGKLERHMVGRAVRVRSADLQKLITRAESKIDEVSKARERALRLARGRAA